MFRKKADIEIVTDRPEYDQGDTVNATARIDVQQHADVSRATVQLACTNRYRYTTTSTDSQGRRTSSTSWSADDRVVAEANIPVDGAVHAGDVLEQTVAFRLPHDAPPSALGTVTELKWEVRARLEARFARDPKGSAEITVRAVPLDRAAWAQLPTVDHLRNSEMGIELDAGSVRRGDRLVGALSVTPHEDIKARRVRVRLERVEVVHRVSGDSATEAVVKHVLADDVGRLPGGVTQHYPFELFVPIAACPSFETATATVRWQVVGEIERRLRRDDEFGVGVHVH